MSTIDRPAAPSRSRTAAFWWFALSAVAIAMFAPLPYLTSSLSSLADDQNRLAANYVDRSLPLRTAFYLHVVFGGTALLLSPIQLSARVRARAAGLHRVVGRITIAAICVAGTAGAVLAPVSLAGGVGTAGFGLLAVLWVVFAVAAARAAIRRDIRAHRRWAIRTFAMTYAAVTLRLWLGVLIAAQSGIAGTESDLAFDRAYQVVPFLCWVPNVIVAHWIINKYAGPATPHSVAQT
ncbi:MULTISPECIES: DUF2306 domain-containing protein [unclassified Pseudofrankia]|uniref:DUF2306 domain-containing protein n=1 Tax=unclassified Pseudofrankia TaxID=2994372 RepID=UPI0008DA361C|nr:MULTISPECIES: DUF2306 domain-containing protein [unclassified Pseudofrankia]MDT3441988.1 DUF2306 domain-containing protein [Pseudofrankia sp. BMG5.37]OHV44611.1 hypothetical protein BCD48_25560 [Pseudofrankia sp. BMG5.36]